MSSESRVCVILRQICVRKNDRKDGKNVCKEEFNLKGVVTFIITTKVTIYFECNCVKSETFNIAC